MALCVSKTWCHVLARQYQGSANKRKVTAGRPSAQGCIVLPSSGNHRAGQYYALPRDRRRRKRRFRQLWIVSYANAAACLKWSGLYSRNRQSTV